MYNILFTFFLLDQKESKNQERSYRPQQVRALLRILSYHAPHLVMNNCTDFFRTSFNYSKASVANTIFGLFFCFSLMSCSMSEEKEVPEDILPVKKMSEVMMDVHLLEAQINLTNYSNNNPSEPNVQPMLDVFKKHSVTAELYNKSIKYYTTEGLDSLNKIYEMVLIDLSKLQAQVNSQVPDTVSQQLVRP
jgi:hypothetical protein